MNSTLLLYLLLGSAALPNQPAAQAAPAVRYFERDDLRVEYRSVVDGGVTVLEGRELNSGREFRFRVRNGRVRGDVGGVPVTFRVSEADHRPPRKVPPSPGR